MGRGETNTKVSPVKTRLSIYTLTNYSQKRKRQSAANSAVNGLSNGAAIGTSKPSAVFQPTEGRDWTVSVALPGSIISK